MSRWTVSVLSFVLVLTMTMGAFQLIAMAVVADDLTDDLGISERTFGWVTAINTIVGALFAPRSGRLTDRIGAKRSVVIVMALSAVGLFITAAAQNVWVLLGSIAISGFGQGWCNPATNRLIADRVVAGRRGTLTGIKQSGVQLGTFLAGVTLPTIASQAGWRWGMFVYGVLSVAAAIGAQLLLTPDAGSGSSKRDASQAADHYRLPRAIWLLSAYALLMGTVVGGVGRFLPLFAENQLGTSNFEAGLVSGLLGGLAIGTRILWARMTESRIAPSDGLTTQAFLTAVAMALLLASIQVGSSLLWLMAVVGALGMNAWNSVAMLAVISGVPATASGRASGVVIFGFMAGLTSGGILTGEIANATDRYDGAWTTFLFLALIAMGLARVNRSVGGRPEVVVDG